MHDIIYSYRLNHEHIIISTVLNTIVAPFFSLHAAHNWTNSKVNMNETFSATFHPRATSSDNNHHHPCFNSHEEDSGLPRFNSLAFVFYSTQARLVCFLFLFHLPALQRRRQRRCMKNIAWLKQINRCVN